MADADSRYRQEIRIRQRTTQRRAARTSFLPFCLPLIAEDEIQTVTDTLRSGWITPGPKTKQFEREFAAYLGVEEALALNSCTAGLHLALEDIDHTKTKAHSPQTNGFCERFHRTVQGEFYRWPSAYSCILPSTSGKSTWMNRWSSATATAATVASTATDEPRYRPFGTPSIWRFRRW